MRNILPSLAHFLLLSYLLGNYTGSVMSSCSHLEVILPSRGGPETGRGTVVPSYLYNISPVG